MIKKIVKYVLIALGIALAILATFVLFLVTLSAFDQSTVILPQGEKVMVIVAHQDDGVIIAGGYCAQNIKMGGDVLIVFTTDGAQGSNPSMETTRQSEAKGAWSVVGVPENNIIFLGYDGLYGLQKKEEVEEAISILIKLIKDFQPDVIFTSLYENGHYQHDVTNYIVGKASELANSDCLVYEGPEYNFYLSPIRTPRKFLHAISRIIPFYEYHAPPEFIEDRPVYEFALDEKLRALKKDMLAKYSSQATSWLQTNFTIRERFQKYKGYDYTRPPFEYGSSLVKTINQMKKVPVCSYFVQKMFGNFRPIHPAQEMYTFSLEFN